MTSRNPEYKQAFIQETATLWKEAVRVVYNKTPPEDEAQKMAEEAWSETGMTPLAYVQYVANPSKATNAIGRGQLSREKRWEAWIAEKTKPVTNLEQDRVTLEGDNEGTAYPWWAIVNPRSGLVSAAELVHHTADAITGPFFSRSAAEEHLKARRYAFGKHATVYCFSGHASSAYRKMIENGKPKKETL